MNQNFRFSEPDIVFDARHAGPFLNWTAPAFEDDAWPLAVQKGIPGDKPWGSLIERPIPLFTRSVHKQYVSLRVETDADDGDGFNALGNGYVPGQDLKTTPLPAGGCNTSAACKAACLLVPACRAAVWTGQSNGCNLKAATQHTLSAASPHTVFIRSYKRLIGSLPYDSQVTPTLHLSDSGGNNGGVRIDIRSDSYFTDASMAAKAAGLGTVLSF
jgi:hypothetical protein